MQILMIFILIFTANQVWAGEADVIEVEVTPTGKMEYRLDVTVQHADEGWEHYVNKWEVVGPDGELLGTRILYHPHVNEQPFTRSLSGVKIPAGTKSVTVRAHDLIHGYGGKSVSAPLLQ